MKLTDSEIKTLKGFYSYTEKEDATPGGLEECDAWLDEHANQQIYSALGVIHGDDYLSHVPQSVQCKLPIDCIIRTVLYDSREAENAVLAGGKHPAEMSIEQLRKRARGTLDLAEDGFSFRNVAKSNAGLARLVRQISLHLS